MVLKIVVLNNIFLLGSGGENHIAEVTKYWSKYHKVQILKPKDDTLVTGLSQLHGLRLYLAIVAIYFSRMIKTPFISIRGSDIIIAISHYPQDVLPAFFLRLMNPKSKLVVYHHGILIPPEHRSIIRMGSLIYNYGGSLLSIALSDLIFTVNKSTRDYLLRFGADAQKVIVTANGVNVPPIKEEYQPKLFDACFLGRLNRSKGVLELPQIWTAVHDKRENARLLIIGGGTEKEELIRLLKNLNLEGSITIAGLVSDDKKYDYLKKSQIFVFPSHLESWGIAVAEAMACGLPVVAYDLPEYKEVFDNKLITVPLGNADELAKQIIYLLDNPQFSKKIGQNGREFVKKYDWSIVADKELSAMTNLKE